MARAFAPSCSVQLFAQVYDGKKWGQGWRVSAPNRVPAPCSFRGIGPHFQQKPSAKYLKLEAEKAKIERTASEEGATSDTAK